MRQRIQVAVIAAVSLVLWCGVAFGQPADCFYRGPTARGLDAWSRAHGGLLRYADLAIHATAGGAA